MQRRPCCIRRWKCRAAMPPQRLPRPSPRSPGGRATATRCCPISSAARRARTATSGSPRERVQAARAGETISRSWLVPNVGVSAGAQRSASTGYGAAVKQAAARHQERQRGGERLVGDRPRRPPARRRAAAAAGHAGGRGRRARRAPAGDDRRRDQLLHARRCAAPARDRARDRPPRRTRRCGS